ncbi:MAG: DEAD/DEAH box helicase [Erysipelotrichaceae bacterium]
MEFNKLDIIEPILKAIAEQGYKEATPIQEQAIPDALLGKDVLGCAQTGTGKTAAFSIPTIQHLKKHNKLAIRSLILTPTRELATQIEENIKSYAKYTTINSTVIFGGVPQKPQEKAISNGVDIVIATPGRLNDLIKQRIVDLSKVEIFILDEADRMLDMGFLNDVKKIIAKLPVKKQTLFFSATMPNEIKALASTLLKDPVFVEVTPVSSTVENIKQSLYYVDKTNKKHLLLQLLEKEKVQSALVFTRTKSNANRLAKFLLAENIPTGVIHGNKSQNARQLALSSFKDGKLRVLVATDIAARGIDVNELSHVFNYEIPNEAESYVHRIGRTGRAGKDGTSISFCDIDEKDYIKQIEKLIKMNIPVIEEHDYPMLVTKKSPKKVQGQGRGNSSHSSKTNRNDKAKVKDKVDKVNQAKASDGKKTSNQSKFFANKNASNNGFKGQKVKGSAKKPKQSQRGR